MIKILHVVHALTRSGGLSNFVMNYYRCIDSTRIQFDFIYFREVEDDFKGEIEQLGGKYYRLMEPSFSIDYLKERESFFREHEGEYKALHCHALFAVAAYANTAKKYGIKNVIAHSHNSIYGTKMLSKLRNYFIVKIAKWKSTFHIACSERAAMFMFGKKEMEQGKVEIITNAIKCDQYRFHNQIREEMRKELDLGEAFTIGHIGGFAYLKNHTFLIDIFHEIIKIHPNSVLLLIGADGIAAGSTKSYIVQKVEKLNLTNNVKFLGVRRDINTLLMAMDAFVFPSISEGMPISLIEAQVSGLPAVVSDVISHDVKLNDYIEFMRIDQPAREWAVKVLSTRIVNCRNIPKVLLMKFDIDVQKQKLENIYLSLH